MAAAKDDLALLDAVLTRFVGDEIVEHNAGFVGRFLRCAQHAVGLDLFERYLHPGVRAQRAVVVDLPTATMTGNLKAQVATLVDEHPRAPSPLEIVKRFHDAHEAISRR